MTTPRRWASFQRLTLIALVLVAGLAVGYWTMTAGPGARLVSPPDSTVAEFSGTGDQSTTSFRVREGWQIEWESSGDRFAFSIAGDRDFGTIVDIDEPGSGTSAPTGSGTFHLDISANGAWTVSILQGD